MFSLVIAAIDISQIIGICVLVISGLSWLVNVVQGNTPDGVPRPKPKKPGQKPQTGRSEIEMLLQQLTGEKAKPKQERRETPKPPKPQQPQSDRNRGKSKPSPARPPFNSGGGSSRPAPRLGDNPSLAPSHVGQEARSHQIGNRIESMVQRDVTNAVQRDIQAAVQHDLGGTLTSISAPRTPTVHPMVAVLRDPNGVREAFILSEILQRPKALRNK